MAEATGGTTLVTGRTAADMGIAEAGTAMAMGSEAVTLVTATIRTAAGISNTTAVAGTLPSPLTLLTAIIRIRIATAETTIAITAGTAGHTDDELQPLCAHCATSLSLSCLGGPKGPPPIAVGSQSDHSRFSNFRHF